MFQGTGVMMRILLGKMGGQDVKEKGVYKGKEISRGGDLDTSTRKKKGLKKNIE